jgi:2-polyprenyl-3-methyl-5-hydroxy-6-metoxy-1,4-benzoquinol methylase
MRALLSGEGASDGKVTKMKNVEREREFHDSLAKNAFGSRKIISEFARSFYDKKIVWAKTWRKIGLLLPGKKILDYGCGAGEFSYALAARGAIVYGIDVSEEAISAAESRLADGGWRPPLTSYRTKLEGMLPVSRMQLIGSETPELEERKHEHIDNW